MANYTWPTTLPAKPLNAGFSEGVGINAVRTPVESGPAMGRRRSARPNSMSCVFLMTTAQVADLEDFVLNTLLGTRRYNWTHPRTGAALEVRVVADSDGSLYGLTALGGMYWRVTLQLEVMP